jgi:hypothetical protein
MSCATYPALFDRVFNHHAVIPKEISRQVLSAEVIGRGFFTMRDKIDHVPEFKHDIDEHTLSKLNVGERYLAMELSKIRKELRWSSETALKAYNKAMENDEIISKWRRLYESPVTVFFWFLGITIVAVVSAIVTRMVGGGDR